MLWIQWTLGKHFLPPAGSGSIFLAKSCQDPWRSGSWLVRDQVNMVDEAKLCSPIRSTFEALVLWHAVERCCAALGPFCWAMPAVGIAVSGVSPSSEHTSQMEWFCRDLESYSGSDRQQTTKEWSWPFSGARLALGSVLELLLGSVTELVT